MGWQEIDLTTVSPVLEPLPAREFEFQLLPGAKGSDFDPNRIEVSAAVTEGEFAGRKVFFSYPDPAKQDWSPRVLARLIQALGVEAMPGESPVIYLNRAAASNARFGSKIRHRKVQTEGGEVTKAELDIFAVKPAA